MGPRIGLLVVVAVVGIVLLLGGTIVGFITDAIWFRSVSFENVFWTRVGTQAGLFVGTFVVGLLILLGGLLLADRAVPQGSGTGISGIGSFFERLAEAAREAEEGTRSGRRSTMRGSYPGPYSDRADGPSSPGASSGRPPFGTGGVALGTDDMPDLTPLARIGLTILAIIIALGIAGSVAGNWETIQLWIHRVPFAPAGAPPVTDPIFGKDISFFLFELPFYRLVQSVVTGLLIGGVILAGGRYLVALLNGPFELTTRIRVHLAVLVGIVLIVDRRRLPARQARARVLEPRRRDRGELHGPECPVHRLRRPDDHHGARRRVPRRRGVHALGLAAGPGGRGLAGGVVHPRHRLPVARPATDGRPEPAGPGAAVHPEQHQHDPARVRPRHWGPKPFKGDAPLTAAAVAQESATFQNARLWDYRPLGDTLDQLQTIRQYYNFTDVDTDRYTINGELRQVMLSARELAPNNTAATRGSTSGSPSPTAIGVAMVPVNQATAGGQPDLIIRDLPRSRRRAPRRSPSPGSTSAKRTRAMSSSTPSSRRSTIPNGADPSGVNGQDAPPWTGTSGIKLDTGLSRLLFALRFGDLNLLISDQVTSDSQLLFRRSLADRLNTIAPFLHYDKDPYLVISKRQALLHPGRLHDQRPVPERPGVRRVHAAGRQRPRPRLVRLHPQQREDRPGRL